MEAFFYKIFNINTNYSDWYIYMDITLNDKYSKNSKRVFVSGVQALVRLMLVMKWIDSKMV